MKRSYLPVLALLAVLFACLLPAVLHAQTEEAKGLDQRIDQWFAPVAAWFERVVFFPIRFSETVRVPFIVVLLVTGALFFTLYFGFVNIRRFGLATPAILPRPTVPETAVDKA